MTAVLFGQIAALAVVFTFIGYTVSGHFEAGVGRAESRFGGFALALALDLVAIGVMYLLRGLFLL